ncbi:MAG TPA: STM4011 family radical SAM protein [Planctomycetota bacterium]
MELTLTILYRGPLASCNYGCWYCPFSKRPPNAADVDVDAAKLARLVNWVESRGGDALSFFFTPWGEALIHKAYQEAILRLAALPQIRKVAAQTNLSGSLDWLEYAPAGKVALWTTYHPGQVSRASFVAQCGRLTALGIRYSVGVVGLLENAAEIMALRAALPPEVYLWINAYKDRGNYYSAAQVKEFSEVDSLFPLNTLGHSSAGRSCRCGNQVVSVDGDGNMRRCHFVPEILGNIYKAGFPACLKESPCPAPMCGCHIGYVHLDYLNLCEVFGAGLLERIPDGWPDALKFRSAGGNASDHQSRPSTQLLVGKSPYPAGHA